MGDVARNVLAEMGVNVDDRARPLGGGGLLRRQGANRGRRQRDGKELTPVD